MAADFRARLRTLLAKKELSLRGTARALNYDIAYLSRVANGKQRPSVQLAAALDELLEAQGRLASLAMPKKPSPSPVGSPGSEADLVRMKTGATHLLTHADLYGGDTVASAAVQIWRNAQHRFDVGAIPEKDQRPYLSAVAEAAEMAGWLLFDAARWEEARRAFLESHMLARLAGDRPMQWFALDMLAMLAVESARPGEALRIADEVLSQPRVPPRVALLARMRRGRALAAVGERQRALADLDAATGGIQESLTSRDPAWAWWVDQREVTGHWGQALISVGAPGEAVPKLQYARDKALDQLSGEEGRSVMHYRIETLRGCVAAGAWREAEEELEAISPLLNVISSGRNRRLLREVLRSIRRASGVPAGLSALAGETADAAAA